jgi:hypothetical protein
MATATCEHLNRTFVSPWESLRKYVCSDCGAIMTCACDEDIAVFVTPYQASRGRDQWTRDEATVTDPLVPNLCHDCRGEISPAYPRAAHRGASSKVHRYYWHEIWKDTQLEFLAWCRTSNLPLFGPDGKPRLIYYHREHAEQYEAIQASVVERWKVRHEQNPRYDFTRPSDDDIIRSFEVTVENIDACYVTSPDRFVRVLPIGATDPTGAVQVEEFVAGRVRTDGRKVMFCESLPFQALYGSLMWLWIQSPSDPRLRPHGFGGRDGVGANEHGLIWMMMSHDFGSPAHARRRDQELQAHLDWLPDDLDRLLWAYDYWQEPSRPLRQYLWAYSEEDQERGRTLIEVLGPKRIKLIMRYLADDYWGRYLGWPDLVSWRESSSGPQDVEFIEVKSSKDNLSDDQRSWIEGNHKNLHLPFRIAKVHRAQRLSVA